MMTQIGRGFDGRQRLSACVVGVSVVIADLAVWKWGQYEFAEVRATLALLGIALLVGLSNGDLRSLGLKVTPVQGWSYWIRAGLIIGATVGVLVLAGWLAWTLSGRALPAYATPRPPGSFGPRFFFMCVSAPIIEEAIYRFLLCTSLASYGAVKAIIASGVAFGLLHVIYGTPSPENLFGGFFLAWAYLKSESILLPVLLHSAGNLIALASQYAAWLAVSI